MSLYVTFAVGKGIHVSKQFDGTADEIRAAVAEYAKELEHRYDLPVSVACAF